MTTATPFFLYCTRHVQTKTVLCLFRIFYCGISRNYIREQFQKSDARGEQNRGIDAVRNQRRKLYEAFYSGTSQLCSIPTGSTACIKSTKPFQRKRQERKIVLFYSIRKLNRHTVRRTTHVRGGTS